MFALKKIYKIKLLFEKLIFSIFFLGFYVFTNSILAIQHDIEDDLKYLEKKDKNFFLIKCKKKLEILNHHECLNFLGIKIFLHTYKNKDISQQEVDILQKKSIYYLETAVQKNSREALKNLGWIYSIKESSLQDLKKSSFHFSNFYKFKAPQKKRSDEAFENKFKKKNVNNSDLILAITLIKKIEIFFEATKSNNRKYLTNEEMKSARDVFNKIIQRRNLSKSKIAELEKKVLANNLLIFSFLKDDIKIFNKKNMIEARKQFEKLKFLLDD